MVIGRMFLLVKAIELSISDRTTIVVEVTAKCSLIRTARTIASIRSSSSALSYLEEASSSSSGTTRVATRTTGEQLRSHHPM